MVTIASPFRTPAVRMLETELTGGIQSDRQIRSPADAALVLWELVGRADREHFVALYLNARHVLTHAHVVSRGTTQTAPVHPREVFKGALLANASALVIGHNHPSGDVLPSDDDRKVAERIREGGELLGVELLDSLIVGLDGSYHAHSEDRVDRLPELLDAAVAEREVTHGS